MSFDPVAWLSLLVVGIGLGIHWYQDVLLRPEVEYTLTELTEYPGSGGGLSIGVKRHEVPGMVTLKSGILVHIRSAGRKPASNVQIRVKAEGSTFIIQVHTDESRLVERLPDIGRQGSPEVFVTVPLMVPDGEVKLSFWYGIPNSPQTKPLPPTVLVRHAEGLGRLKRLN